MHCVHIAVDALQMHDDDDDDDDDDINCERC